MTDIHALNREVADLSSRIAWYVAACLRDGGEFSASDVVTLRERVAVLESTHAAAVDAVAVLAAGGAA